MSWPNIDVFVHGSHNLLGENYCRASQVIALPVSESKLIHFQLTPSNHGDLELMHPVHSLDDPNTKKEDRYRYMAWSPVLDGVQYFAAATLTFVKVWTLNKNQELRPVVEYNTISSKICKLAWAPHSHNLLVHAAKTIHLVALNGHESKITEIVNPIQSTKQVACWNTTGNTLILCGGKSIELFRWERASDIPCKSPLRSKRTLNSTSCGDIVGVAFLNEDKYVVTTELQVQLTQPTKSSLIVEATKQRLVDVKSSSDIIDVMHVKRKDTSSFSLILPELHDNLPILSTANSLSPTEEPQLAIQKPTSFAFLFHVECSDDYSSKISLPSIARPNIVHGHETGIVAIGSHVTSSCVLVLACNDKSLTILQEFEIPVRQVHGLRVVSMSSGCVVHILDGPKPQTTGFFSSSTLSCELTHRSFHIELQVPNEVAKDPAQEINDSSLESLLKSLVVKMEQRFDRVEMAISSMDARLRRIEESFKDK